MVSQSFTSVFFLVSLALANPLPVDKRNFGGFQPVSFGSGFGFDSFHSSSQSVEAVSLSSWHGFSSLDHFDDFYGQSNFCGFETSLETVAIQKEEVVCHSVSVEIIQQQLAVIREYVKRIITTQICEIETQTIVFSQFQAGIVGFGEDIRHVSGRQIGFDSSIADHIVNIHDGSGSLVSNDLGFSGNDVGKSFVTPSGFNWDDSTSPASVGQAFSAASSAAGPGILSSSN